MSSMLRQAANILATKLMMPLGAFVILVYIAQKSDLLLGQYALVTTYYFILQTLPLLGLPNFYMREVARAPEQAGQFFITIGSVAVLACLTIHALALLLFPHFDYTEELKQALILVTLVVIPGVLTFLAEITLTALQKTDVVPRIAFVENALRILFSIVFVALGYGILSIVWVLMFTKLISLVCYLLLLKTEIPRRNPQVGATQLWRWQPSILRSSFSVMPVFFLNTLLSLLLSRMDFIALSMMESVKEVGYYAVGYRVFEVGGLLFTAVISAIYPLLAKAYSEQGKAEFETIQKHYLTVFSLLAVPAAIIGYCLSDTLISLLFPEQFDQVALLARLFFLLLMVFALDAAMSFLLIACNQQKSDTLSLMVSAPIYAVLLIVWIPLSGLYGAFWAGATTLIVQLLCRTGLLCYKKLSPWQARRVVTFVVVSTLPALIIAMLDSSGRDYQDLYLLYGCLVHPFLLYRLGYIQPLRALIRFSIQANKSSDGRFAAAFQQLQFWTRDRLRYNIWVKRKYGNRSRVHGTGMRSVTLYRLSRALLLLGCVKMARLVWHLQCLLCKNDLRPSAEISGGFVIDSTVNGGYSGILGDNITAMPMATVSADGLSKNSGLGEKSSGIHLPVFHGDTVLQPCSSVMGKIEIPRCSVIPIAEKVHNMADFRRLFGG